MDHLLKILGFLLMLQTVNALGCADGFISFGEVPGCFKTFAGKRQVSWHTAKETCEDLQLQMVKPTSNEDAIRLRKALLDTFGHGTFWLGARGDVTQYSYVWNDGTPLSNSDPLWFPGHPGNNIDNFCLTISVNRTNWENYPKKPYGIGPCSKQWYATICEAVCPYGCFEGQCTSHNTCTCSDGYTGYTCDTPVCPYGCVNGICTNPNQCQCSYGWTGNTCDIPMCDQDCVYGQGECTGRNQCTCFSGYTGPRCNTRIVTLTTRTTTDPYIQTICETATTATTRVPQWIVTTATTHGWN